MVIPEHILQSYDTMENDNSKMDYMEMDYLKKKNL